MDSRQRAAMGDDVGDGANIGDFYGQWGIGYNDQFCANTREPLQDDMQKIGLLPGQSRLVSPHPYIFSSRQNDSGHFFATLNLCSR